MAETATYLAVALSGRALAVAARRAGCNVVVLDLFGDTDTRAAAAKCEVVPGSLSHGLDAAALLDAAERLAPAGATPPFGLVYGSGLEDRPELLASLARGRRLCGNPPEVVARTKDPREFFRRLARLDVPCPETVFHPPAEPTGWLTKRIGASGGSHVVPAPPDDAHRPDRYYQRRVAGRPIGVSFLADGKRAVLLGFSEQWTWARGDGNSFLFGGALQPAPVHPAVAGAMPALLDALTAEFGLIGLNSLDILADGDRYHAIEINPRPGANLDIFEGYAGVPLFALHVAAFAGRLPAPDTVSQSPRATAMAVVYAERPSLVPPGLPWPEWVADRPAQGAEIDAGAPVCTVLAQAETPDLVRRLAEQRVEVVLSHLLPRPSAPGEAAVDAVVGA